MTVYIVLGGGLDTNYHLNEHTKQRYQKLLNVIKKDDIIICSSNKSYRKLQDKHHPSEAQVGKDYLLERGVQEHILLEEESRDTLSNAFYCRKNIIDPKQIKEFTVITSAFHMEKTKFVFQFVFGENYTIHYITSPNGNVNKQELQARIESEKHVLNFYKKHLEQTYGITPGNMQQLEEYMTKHNPSYTGRKDKYHEALTQNILKTIQGNPLY